MRRDGGTFFVGYYDRLLLISPPSMAPVLERPVQAARAPARGWPSPGARKHGGRASTYAPGRVDRAQRLERGREKEVLKRRLAAVCEDPDVAKAIDDQVNRLNGKPGTARASTRSMRCCSSRVCVFRSGASPRRRSTTAASSMSMTWPRSGWSPTSCSTTLMRSFFAMSTRDTFRAFGSTTSTGSTTRPLISTNSGRGRFARFTW